MNQFDGEIVLLHGYGSRARDLKELALGLGDDQRVYTPDLSPFYRNREKYSFTDQVNMLVLMIDEQVKGRDFHLLGLSYGGALAWAVASQIGSQCKSLSLINPMTPFPVKNLRPLPMRLFFSMPWNTYLLVNFLKGGLGDEFVSYLMNFFGRKSKLRKSGKTVRFISHVIHNFLSAVSEEDWGAWELNLAHIKCSALICYSPLDPLFRPESFVKLGGSLQDVRFIKLDSHLHIPTPDQLAELSVVLTEFIQRVEEQSKAA